MEKADIGASTVKNHVDHHHGKKGELIENKVESKILSPFIDKQVDLLKLDIEGSEGCVFNEIRDKFHQLNIQSWNTTITLVIIKICFQISFLPWKKMIMHTR